MRRVFVGTRVNQDSQLEVTYSILVEETDDGEEYGIQVETKAELIQIPAITPLQKQILSFADQLLQGFVTPVTVKDILLDWLEV